MLPLMVLSPQSMIRRWGIGLLVFAVALFLFSRDLLHEPYFIDEGAYIAGTYFYRLMKDGDFNHVDWFHLGSYDHLNVGRSIMGATLDTLGIEVPRSIHLLEDWYGINGPVQTDVGNRDPDRLLAARGSMLIGGALGCWAIYMLANEFIGPVTGILAACFLAASPLYWTHSRRAMADNWVIAFGLIGLTAVIFLAKRLPIRGGRRFHLTRSLPCVIIAGLAFGLSAATKLSGLSILMGTLVGAGVIMAIAAPWRQFGPSHAAAKRWGVFIVAMLFIAGATFIAVHPFFYARPKLPDDNPNEIGIVLNGELRDRTWINGYVRPLRDAGIWERLRYLIHYRQSVLDDKKIQERFAADALPTVSSRLHAMLYEGLGARSFGAHVPASASWRFVPVALLMVVGLIWSIMEGRRHWQLGLLPVTWILVAWFFVEGAILARELTLNWDRYYMAWVTLASILSALGVTGPITSLSRKLVLLPPVPVEEPIDPIV
jgi:hypothetical protein